MKSKYSKPVLTAGNDSSYKKNINFKFELCNAEDALRNDGILHFIVKIKLGSNRLMKLFEETKCKIGIAVQTLLFKEFKEVNHFENIEICIDTKRLKRNDTIKLQAFVMASDSIELNYNDELLDFYKGDYTFDYHKNEIMAESNLEKIYYKSNGQPFIQIGEMDREDIGFSIEKNIIKINVCKDFNIAFNKLQDKSIAVPPKDILNSFIAFNAIQYSLIRAVVDGVKTVKDTEWYKALEYNYNDLEDELSLMSGDISNLDIDKIVKITQEILHNKLNNMIVNTWRESNGNSIKKN